MALFSRSERGIGRGERAESRLEAPFFTVFMVLCAVLLFIVNIYLRNPSITMAIAVSMVAFGATVIRVEVGIYILILAMLLSPEIQTGNVGASAQRDINIRYDDILIMIIFLGVLVKLAFEGRVMLWRQSPINVGIFAYYMICILSTLDALRFSLGAWDKSVAFFVLLKMLEFYIIFFMVGLAINDNRIIRRQVILFLVVALVVSVYGIFSIGSVDRVSAPFESGGTEPNTMGGYLMLVICLSSALFLYAPKRKQKLMLSIITITAFIPFVMTLSRASYMSLIVCFVAMAVLTRRFAILVFLVVFLALSPFIMPKEAIDRVKYTFLEDSGVPISVGGRQTNIEVDKSTYERVYVWQKVRHNLSVWPWIGGGIAWGTVLDSQFARVIIETGLVGLCAFVFMLYRIIRTASEAHRWTRDWMMRGLCLGMCAASIGLIVHCTGTISFLIVRIMEPFWFLMALVVVARDNAIREHAAQVFAQRKQAAEQAQTAPASPQVAQSS